MGVAYKKGAAYKSEYGTSSNRGALLGDYGKSSQYSENHVLKRVFEENF